MSKITSAAEIIKKHQDRFKTYFTANEKDDLIITINEALAECRNATLEEVISRTPNVTFSAVARKQILSLKDSEQLIIN